MTWILGPRQKKPLTPIDERPISHINCREDTQVHPALDKVGQNDQRTRSTEPHSIKKDPSSSESPTHLPGTFTIPSTRKRTPKDQKMSPRAKIDESAITLRGMLANINIAMEPEDDDALKFVPESVLKRIMNPKSVEKVLEDHISRLQATGKPPQTPISELTEFFTTKAFKVFAILAENNSLDLVEQFYQNGFHNDMLPVRKKLLTTNPKVWEIESYNTGDGVDEKAREKVREQVRNVFRYGGESPWGTDSRLINKFYQDWQWPFIPPVFLKGKFRYEFPVQIHLPFTRSANKKESAVSFFSYVQEKSVHADHLPKDFVSHLNLLTNSIAKLCVH